MLETQTTIGEFRGEYRFLSNFSKHSFIDKDGITWATSEHYYQAKKVALANDPLREAMIMRSTDPGEAKKLAVGIKPDNWYDISIDIMRQALRYKFDQNEDIKQKLLDTGDALILEGNHWGDVFWGVCKGKGLNMLGKLLMELRNDYRREESR